ncbi:hypothetical protein H4R18_003278 [Coemansia javaensis]|uniref:Uncharacterized protein n=1 Tax=Coemansia javaensis TaxID=2761396 RepID=A0A9W8LHJ7_9FUNG|nr:hypothetical protein H4R18_003278 [Coemansia javaensis]
MRIAPALLAMLAVGYAHYECTTQQAFDVLFSNSTTNAFAAQLLTSLRNGVAEVRGRLEGADAKQAANRILSRYRAILTRLPPNVSARLPQI